MASISEDEQQKRTRKTKMGEIISVVCVLLVFVSIMAVFTAEQYHIHSVYSEAEKLISEERFLEAEEALKKIADSDYKDTAALLLLCDAHRDYAAGNLVGAYYAMKDAHFEHQSSEALSIIQSFKQNLKKEYEQYSKELAARRAQEYKERLKNGVPYVGMYESRIGDTSLGKPSDKVRHNYQVKNGEQYLANLYDFYDGKNLIFTARCINGVVTEVWDYRDDPVKPYAPGNEHTLSTGPSVDGFLNPEDFYDWYRDDFFDYYDAEEYYYAHGGT